MAEPSYEQVLAENRRLKAENDRLRKRVEALEQQLQKLSTGWHRLAIAGWVWHDRNGSTGDCLPVPRSGERFVDRRRDWVQRPTAAPPRSVIANLVSTRR